MISKITFHSVDRSKISSFLIFSRYIQEEITEETVEKTDAEESDGKDEETVSHSCSNPQLIPLGPTIKTPNFTNRAMFCPKTKTYECRLSKDEEKEPLLEKIMCNTEDVLMNMFFPGFIKSNEVGLADL